MLLGADVATRRLLASPDVGSHGKECVFLRSEDTRENGADSRIRFNPAAPQERGEESLRALTLDDLEGGGSRRRVRVRQRGAHRDGEAASPDEDEGPAEPGDQDEHAASDENVQRRHATILSARPPA